MSIERKTEFSADRVYRFTLWRDWSNEGFDFVDTPNRLGTLDQFVQFIGLNPSTADETLNDPTIIRCMGYAKRWGFGALCMTNLFAFRETDPKKLRKVREPEGTNNDYHLLHVAEYAALIICAWGRDGKMWDRQAHVLNLLMSHRARIRCLGSNGDGTPVHPLYQPKDVPLLTYGTSRV